MSEEMRKAASEFRKKGIALSRIVGEDLWRRQEEGDEN
jgi:hypothetical protein